MTAATQAKPKPQKAAAKKAAAKVTNIDGTEDKDTGPRYTRKSYPAPPEGYTLYEAGPGGAGFINVRAHNKVMKFAACISDPDATAEGAQNPDWVKGLISRFFDSEDKALKYKESKEELGYKVEILNVRVYTGPTHEA